MLFDEYVDSISLGEAMKLDPIEAPKFDPRFSDFSDKTTKVVQAVITIVTKIARVNRIFPIPALSIRLEIFLESKEDMDLLYRSEIHVY